MNEHTNAVAGPSTISSSSLPPSTVPHPSLSSSTPHSSVPTLLFLPPPAPPPQKQHLASTQDLLSRFHLLPAYNKYVRSPLLPGTDPSNEAPSTPGVPITPGTLDKGKGKEVVHGNAVTMGNTPAVVDLGDRGDGDDDDDAGGKGEKKKKNTYKHLIKGIPGKHSLKKDDSLTKVMLVPPKQAMKIVHFDPRTQEDAFTVSLEGLKGWNINTLVLESAQAREDRKKRKELKRLAKLQVQQGVPLSQVSTPSQQQQPHITSTASPAIVHPQPMQAPIPVPPASAVSSRGPSTLAPQRVGTPKLMTNGYVNGNGIVPPKMVVNARAGTDGVRPRPVKKQRMDVQGQARDIAALVQQPTPQGV